MTAPARTIAQYEQPPADPDEEALCKIISQWMGGRLVNTDQETWPAALAQFKRELEARK